MEAVSRFLRVIVKDTKKQVAINLISLPIKKRSSKKNYVYLSAKGKSNSET